MMSRQIECLQLNVVAIALALFSVAIAGCGSSETNGNRVARIPVVTAEASRQDILRSRDYSGSVEGIRQATVSARLAETIERVNVRKGDAIRAGQTVVVFDQSGPSTSLRQAQAVYDDAKRTYEKFERLFAEGAVSELERDSYRTAAEVARANYESARDAANILAPISGIVTDVQAKAGRQTVPGSPLVEIASIDTARVLIDVSVYEARDLSKGLPVRIHAQLDSTAAGEGWVDQIASSADPNTRMLRIEVLAANAGHRLLPGMFVTASVEFERRTEVIAVPRDALVYRESGLGAFVVRDSVAHYTPVTTGAESAGLVEILSGISDGETIVTLGQNSLQDGSLVNPVPQTVAR
jgi:RND family efflux transporter MFP subunit